MAFNFQEHLLRFINYNCHSSNTIIGLHSLSIPRIQKMSSEGTILITGANGGLGTAYVEKLIHLSYLSYGLFTVPTVPDSSSAALQRILLTSRLPHSILPLELGSLASVRAFASDVNSNIASGQFPK